MAPVFAFCDALVLFCPPMAEQEPGVASDDWLTVVVGPVLVEYRAPFVEHEEVVGVIRVSGTHTQNQLENVSKTDRKTAFVRGRDSTQALYIIL